VSVGVDVGFKGAVVNKAQMKLVIACEGPRSKFVLISTHGIG
jgi:hypothetical protein